MAKDHYVPAAVIGRFSAQKAGAARDRTVAVARGTNVFSVAARGIGYVNGLYDIGGGPLADAVVTSVDPLINGYESNLPAALDSLEVGDIDLKAWLRTLVPFVAALFVRGVEFRERFVKRFRGNFWPTEEDTNNVRAIELQRLLSPVMCARWVVTQHEQTTPFILNDLGLTLTRDPASDAWGFAIPLSTRSILGIYPSRQRTVARCENTGWRPVIEYRYLEDVIDRDFANRSIASFAYDWIVGPDREAVMRYQQYINDPRLERITAMEIWPFSHRTKAVYEHDWHRLISVTDGDPAPAEISSVQDINFKALANGWCPAFIAPVNLRQFPSGLKLIGRQIQLNMQPIANFDDYIISPDELDGQ